VLPSEGPDIQVLLVDLLQHAAARGVALSSVGQAVPVDGFSRGARRGFGPSSANVSPARVRLLSERGPGVGGAHDDASDRSPVIRCGRTAAAFTAKSPLGLMGEPSPRSVVLVAVGAVGWAGLLGRRQEAAP
jgi:hypothetical protein